MAKQNLLLVDADLRSVRVLEVSLRKAGYNVASAGNAKEALAMLELSRPDLVLCDTRLPTMDGFELIQELRRRPELAGIPLMILSSDVSVETKVRGLELGVEDYLTKPIYIKELLARVNIVLQRKRREGIERLEHGHKRKFSGSLSDMGVVDLLQAIDHNKKSGVLYLTSGRFDGAIYFCNGAPVDAAVGKLRGSRAIYRSLLWTDGTFEIDFREIDREDHVKSSMQAVLMEGLRRVDEWGRLLEQLPNLETVFDVSDTQLMARLADIPDQINSVLREFDGKRSLWEIVDACDADDLDTLSAVSKLYFEGLLYNTGRQPGDADAPDAEPEPMSDLSDMALPHISSGPPVITHTLAPAWGSVPSDDGSESQLIDDTLQLNIPATPKLPEGLRITSSEAPRRRKARKRKKRSGQSLPAAGDTTRKHAKPAKGKAKADEADVRVVDESVAEITPSTIAPPPEEAENAAIVQAEQADVPTVVVPSTAKPPQLPPSRPESIGAGATLPQASQSAIHENPTLDFLPVARPATPPPLRAAPEEAASALKSTAPPPLSEETSLPAGTPDFQSDEETTEKQVSLRGSIPPPYVESYVPRKAASPPPLPYTSKPPSPGFGSPRGVTSPGFAAAPVDEETIAAAAAAISEAETAPPPLAARRSAPGAARRDGSLDAPATASMPPALRSGAPADDVSDAEVAARGLSSAPARASRTPEPERRAASRGTTWDSASQRPPSVDDEWAEPGSAESPVSRTNPAPYPASIPARDFEAAILASIAPPPPSSGSGATDAPSAAVDVDSEEGVAGSPASSLRSASPDDALSEAEALGSAEPASSRDTASASGVADPSSARPSELGRSSSIAASTSPEVDDSEGVAAEGTSARPRVGGMPASLSPEQLKPSARGAGSSVDSSELSAASIVPEDLSARASDGAAAESHSARPSDASHSPLAAASITPGDVDIASARGNELSAPPSAAESVPAEHGGSQADDAGATADGSSVDVPPNATGSLPPGGGHDADADASRGAAAHGLPAQSHASESPPMAADSAHTESYDSVDASLDESGAVSARPRELTAPPTAAESLSPGERESSLAHGEHEAAAPRGAASARPDFTAPSPAGVSLSPAEREDSDLEASRGSASEVLSVQPFASVVPREHAGSDPDAALGAPSEVMSARPRDFSAPPKAAESLPPGERQDAEADDSLDAGTGGLSARPRDFSAPPTAAESLPPGQHQGSEADAHGADAGDLSAESRAFSAPPAAAEALPPGERQDAEADDSIGADSDVLSARPRDFSAPPSAAESLPPGERQDAEADDSLDAGTGGLSARPRDFSAPPTAAEALPPGERQGSEADDSIGADSDVLSTRLRDFSEPPTAAESLPPGERHGSEADASLDAGADGLSARPRDFSAPPTAAESLRPSEHRDAEAGASLGAVSDVLSARPRDFSAPPTAVASTPPREHQDAGSEAADMRELAAPPLAAASDPPPAEMGSDSSEGEVRSADLGSDGDEAARGRTRDLSVRPSAASMQPDRSHDFDAQSRAEEDSDAGGPPELAIPPLVAASSPPEQMDDSEQRAFSGRTLIEGRDFAMPALAGASLPPDMMADSADAELVQTSLPPLASSAPANDVSAPHKPEEDFSDLVPPDERSSSSGAAAPQERASPPPLPTTGRRSIAPRTRTSPPPLPYSRTRAEAEARLFGSQPPLATATEPPPGAAALSSPQPPAVDTDTAPGGYVAISPEEHPDDSSKRIRAPLQRTAVPPPFAPDAAPPSAITEVEDAAHGVELTSNRAPPPISPFTSSVKPDESQRSEPAADDASALSAAWMRQASAPVDTEEEARADLQLAAARITSGTAAEKRDSNQASAVTRNDAEPSKRPDAAESASPKTGDSASLASGRPRSSSQRPRNTSNVISFVPRKRAEDAGASGSGTPSKMAGDDAPAQGGGTTTPPGAGRTSAALSQAAPQPKRRISRWVQAGGAAATVALAAGLFALRARDAAPQGSLNTAVPEAVEAPAVAPPTAANDVKEQALGELEALHEQAQALPGALPQPTAAEPPAAPAAPAAPTAQTAGAAEPSAAPAEAPQQEAVPADQAKQQTATAEPAKQQPAPDEQTDKQPPAASDAPSNAAQTLAKGRSLEQRGKKQDAIDLYAKAVEEGHGNSQMLSRMAFLYLNQGKNALAETAAKRAADADETNSEAWIVLGAALDGLGKKPAAEEAYRNCAQKGQGQYVTECKRMLR